MHRRNLFVILSTAMIVVIMIGTFAASGFVRKQLTENLITEYSQQEGVLARQIAQTLELEVAQAQAKLNLIAQLPEVMSGDTETCNEKLKTIFDDPQTKVGNLGRVGPDGVFRCSLNQKLIGVKAESLGPYIATIFNDPEHKAVMSRAIKPPGATSYLVAIHVPVWGPSGEFMGTLGGAVYLNDLERLYLRSVQLAPGGYIALYDDDGTVLYNYKPELIGLNIASDQFQQLVKGASSPLKSIQDTKNGTSGTSRYSFDQDEKIAAFEPVHIFEGRNWRIVVTVPIRAVHENVIALNVDRTLKGLPLSLCILTILLLLLFLWTTAREVFTPMEAVDRAKSEFVSLASHQLRTPLSAINWYTEMLLAGDAGKLTKDQKEYLQEIYRGNQRMVSLVNALLNVSRMELGTFMVEPEPTDTVQLVKDVIAEQVSQIKQKNIQLVTSFEEKIPVLQADPKLLRMVAQNLLSNAVKYTPDGGSVFVSLALSKQNILLTVSDTGYGIPKDQQDKIFTKLFRADNVQRKDTEGTGLGLYIVKSIVEQAHGQVWFESPASYANKTVNNRTDKAENPGTTFYVSFPLAGMKKKQGTKALT